MGSANIISIVVLKERLINNIFSTEQPLFEESLYLLNLDINDKTKKQLLTEIHQQLKPTELSYKNEFHEKIEWKIVKIIDIFDNIDGLTITEFPNEVYSRHLSLPPNSTLDDAISQFYSDYIWED